MFRITKGLRCLFSLAAGSANVPLCWISEEGRGGFQKVNNAGVLILSRPDDGGDDGDVHVGVPVMVCVILSCLGELLNWVGFFFLFHLLSTSVHGSSYCRLFRAAVLLLLLESLHLRSLFCEICVSVE